MVLIPENESKLFADFSVDSKAIFENFACAILFRHWQKSWKSHEVLVKLHQLTRNRADMNLRINPNEVDGLLEGAIVTNLLLIEFHNTFL